MKRVIILVLSSLLIIVSFVGCNSKLANSEKVKQEEKTKQKEEKQEEKLTAEKHPIIKLEESIGEQIVAKNFQKAYNIMIANGDMTNIDESQLKDASSLFVQQMQKTFSKNGGVVEYRVENIEADNNAKTIDLSTTIIYQNGKRETKSIRYFKRNGEWKRGIVWDN